MPREAHATPPAAERLAAMHALAWLVAGNLVGLLMAVLLLAPQAGAVLGPLTWGRWAPVHLDLQLYGWASLPLVALLLSWYLPGARAGRLPALAVHAWSAAVLLGAISWLAGGSSGKLFLEWSGGARWMLAAAMGLLAVALLVAFLRRDRSESRALQVAKGALLAALLPVPAILFWSASPEVYPSINPDSGGATGGSLLGSTLGIVALVAGTPLLLHLRPRRLAVALRTFALIGLHFGLFLLLDHGDHSHHEPLQVAALASLLVWLPLLRAHLREFDWPPTARRWLLAAGAWALVLVATGLFAFLPGVLERWKFTHSLVGHAHVALAGFVSAWNLLVLVVLDRGGAIARSLDGRRSFVLWNAGLVAHLVALFALGALEASSPGGLLRPGALPDALLTLRVAGGAVQLIASWRWLTGAWKALAAAESGDAAAAPAEAVAA